LTNYFGTNVDVTLTSIVCNPTSLVSSDPSQIDYSVAADFDSSPSSRPPGMLELDLLIQSAFLLPASEELLATLNALPNSNPFSSTTAVRYEGGVVLQSLEGMQTTVKSSTWLWPISCIIALVGGVVSYFAAIAAVECIEARERALLSDDGGLEIESGAEHDACTLSLLS
jgi:hypothetical protein